MATILHLHASLAPDLPFVLALHDRPSAGEGGGNRTRSWLLGLLNVAVDLVGFEPTTVRVRAGCSDSTELQIRDATVTLLGVSACRTPFPLMVDPKGLAPPSNWVRASCSAAELRVDGRPLAVTYRGREASPDAGECGRRLKGQDSNLRAGLLHGWLTASCLTTRLPLNEADERGVPPMRRSVSSGLAR